MKAKRREKGDTNPSEPAKINEIRCEATFALEALVVLVRRQVEAIEAPVAAWRPFGSLVFSIVKRRGPSLPWRSLKAWMGTREVPVVDWSRRALRSAGHERNHAQNHSITRPVFSYPRLSVNRVHSFMSISVIPPDKQL